MLLTSLALLLGVGTLAQPLHQDQSEHCCGPFLVSRGSLMGYIDSSGQVVIDFRFYAAQPFSEDLASVRINRDGKDGYIDNTGRFVIDPNFDWAFPFKEARAKVRVNGKWGWIVEPTLEDADNFSQGRAAVKLFGKWGYIDQQGKVVIPAVFERVNRFSEGFACVIKHDLLGYVDKTGKWIINPRFEPLPSRSDELHLANFREGLAVAKTAQSTDISIRVGGLRLRPFLIELTVFQRDWRP